MMSVFDKLWEAITTVIRMNDRLEHLAITLKHQQEKMEQLSERVFRLEVMLEITQTKQSDRSQKLRQLENKI